MDCLLITAHTGLI